MYGICMEGKNFHGDENESLLCTAHGGKELHDD
jgi:hypothetical protein